MNGIAYLWKKILNYFHTIVGTEDMKTSSATTVKGAIAELNTPDYEVLTWKNNTAGEVIALQRCGKLRILRIQNPTKLAVGYNTINTLASEDCPPASMTDMLISPIGSISAGGQQLALRVEVHPTGEIKIYNYRSTPISNTNTNAAAMIPWIVA